MSITAMKQALEALEEINKLSIGEEAICLPAEIDTAMDALHQAIEQAEKQVAYTTGHCKEKAQPNGCQLHNLHCGYPACDRKAVATPQPQREWVGLTDEEIMEMLDYGQYGRVPQYARNFVDAIEAKLKEKNHDVR